MEWLADNKLARYCPLVKEKELTLDLFESWCVGTKSDREKEEEMGKNLTRMGVRDVDQQYFINAIKRLASDNTRRGKQVIPNKVHADSQSQRDEEEADEKQDNSVVHSASTKISQTKITMNSLDKQKSLQVTHLKEKMNEILSNNDINWIVGSIDISGLKIVNDKSGHDAADTVIDTVKRTISDYCEHNNPSRFRFYKDDSYGKGDLFAILIDTRGDMDQAKAHIHKIIDKLRVFEDVHIRIGITNVVKFDKNDDATKIYDRALKCANKAKELIMKTKNNNNNNNNNNTNNNGNNNDDEKSAAKNNVNEKCYNYVWQELSYQRWCQLVELKKIEEYQRLGTKKEFQQKIREIANYGDTRYALCIMDGDNVGSIKKESPIKVTFIMEQVEIEIRKLCNKYNNLNTDTNTTKAATLYGYHISAGDEYGMFVGGSGAKDKQFIEKAISELGKNFVSSCGITFSFGLSFVKVNDSASLLEDRAEKALQMAKANGKNRFCWI